VAKTSTIQHVKASKTQIECKRSEILGSTTQFSIQRHAWREQGALTRSSSFFSSLGLAAGSGGCAGSDGAVGFSGGAMAVATDGSPVDDVGLGEHLSND
jgi:hypothetical protein